MVDDTSSVWHHHADSLLTVERYVFFPSSKQALGMTGESFLESRRWGLCLGLQLRSPARTVCNKQGKS